MKSETSYSKSDIKGEDIKDAPAISEDNRYVLNLSNVITDSSFPDSDTYKRTKLKDEFEWDRYTDIKKATTKARKASKTLVPQPLATLEDSPSEDSAFKLGKTALVYRNNMTIEIEAMPGLRSSGSGYGPDPYGKLI